MARRGKDRAAPRDRPRAKKKVIRAPAVSPSLGSTNLAAEKVEPQSSKDGLSHNDPHFSERQLDD